MKSKHILTLALLLLFLSISGAVFCQPGIWKAPADVDKINNPFKGSSTFAAEGKKTFESTCVTCHGEKGKGNGAAGVSLTPKPANFLAISVRNESDGALFWKISEGNPPMAAYKDILTTNQRWQLVCYIRELESKTK
jgi:mono/diheme cytochrome c family protein